MEKTNLTELMHSCMEIEKLSDISHDYEEIVDSISLIDDFVLDEFRYLRDFEDYSFYVNISEIEEEAKSIKKYAIGLVGNDNNNIVRFDNVDHHNNHKKVKEKNPPHHKHLGAREKVEGFSGELDDLILELEAELSKQTKIQHRAQR